ncbi:DUF4760 domain-containing protein [Lacimicrobium alkaliphilum]|uniref:Uncharacterized protein n=1 Tax=Lacimicrobium alkaliphilum TaxID=1526571 RepID=A0A0U2QMR3_9ALTE|nr:hypothetical protein [Lacimicrobium alkaliphilum]ALS98779.1 hypothetical protein AT746_11185 [Lacimicrobium alkaliphilum]
MYLDKGTAYLPALAVSISATFALFATLRTLYQNIQLNRESNTLQAIGLLWKGQGEKRLGKKSSGDWRLSDVSNPIQAINQFNQIQLRLLERDKGQQHIAVLGSILAMFGAPDVKFKGVELAEWKRLSEKLNIDRDSLRKGLNEAEKLCQGIQMGVYDEKLVQNYLGADLSALVTYMLSYIYCIREVHAMRLVRRARFINEVPFAQRGEHYSAHKESHDLMYEYLEYYCYRWYFTDVPREFGLFHQHLQQVYQQLRDKIASTEISDTQAWQGYCPFIAFASDNNQRTFNTLTAFAAKRGA